MYIRNILPNPPILGVIAFVLCLFDISLFDNHEKFAKMSGLSSSWTCDFDGDGGGGMSAAPIYLGMMAIVGAYLIKDSIKYFFIKE